ncbi:hypothetical protein [Cupriavidus necator]|nr:hypothetical protein [Cupriavidus necator]MDX6008387.1 hypothetical protein [Cupriavidus necator]
MTWTISNEIASQKISEIGLLRFSARPAAVVLTSSHDFGMCDSAIPQAETRARLEAQATALTDRLAAAEQAQRRQMLELEAGTELAAAQRRAEAEAALARQLLAEMRVALHERDGGGRWRGKVRGQSPAVNEAQNPQKQE